MSLTPEELKQRQKESTLVFFEAVNLSGSFEHAIDALSRVMSPVLLRQITNDTWAYLNDVNASEESPESGGEAVLLAPVLLDIMKKKKLTNPQG